MTVQDTVPPVVVPRQAEPADPPLAAVPPAAAAAAEPLVGRDRPLTAEERQFGLALVALFLVLGTFIVTGLLLAEYVWS